MSETVILAEGLTKFYGKQRGVVGLDMEVLQGEVFGFLGPNGAGKTTTIRLCLDFIRPTSGRVAVFGMDARQHACQVHMRTGYLPGDLSLYGNLTGGELLTYASHLRGGVDWGFVHDLATRLECNLSRPIRALSHGNRQKIGLIHAMMHGPELLVLDEPTSGLDPLMQQEFYRLVAELKAAGRTVFLSSHIMPEVERVCDRVGIIRDGELVVVESVQALKARALRHLEIHFSATVPPEVFSGIPGVRDVAVEDSVLRCTIVGTLDPVIKAAARFEVVNVISREPSLEEVFLAYYDRGDADAP
ncbi:MAG: ABC transporter ATP-binding protein [Chloroflexi bacterium]|nr:ABC transporter ATP-binding protein [Chloroflexota bacterium]